MLSCSLRLGPTVDGEQQIWHLEEKAGADIVVTCPPSLIDEVINFPRADEIKFKPNQIDVDPPAEVMDKLMKIPYFSRAYDEDGYTREEYNTHPALVKTPRPSRRPPTRWSRSPTAASRATARPELLPDGQ